MYQTLAHTVASLSPLLPMLPQDGLKNILLENLISLFSAYHRRFSPAVVIGRNGAPVAAATGYRSAGQYSHGHFLGIQSCTYLPWQDIATIDMLLDQSNLPHDIVDAMTESEREALRTHRNLRPGYEYWKTMITEVSRRLDRKIDQECQFWLRQIAADMHQRDKILGAAIRDVGKQITQQVQAIKQ